MSTVSYSLTIDTISPEVESFIIEGGEPVSGIGNSFSGTLTDVYVNSFNQIDITITIRSRSKGSASIVVTLNGKSRTRKLKIPAGYLSRRFPMTIPL